MGIELTTTGKSYPMGSELEWEQLNNPNSNSIKFDGIRPGTGDA